MNKKQKILIAVVLILFTATLVCFPWVVVAYGVLGITVILATSARRELSALSRTKIWRASQLGRGTRFEPLYAPHSSFCGRSPSSIGCTRRNPYGRNYRKKHVGSLRRQALPLKRFDRAMSIAVATDTKKRRGILQEARRS